jgi:hypothetical protein
VIAETAAIVIFLAGGMVGALLLALALLLFAGAKR